MCASQTRQHRYLRSFVASTPKCVVIFWLCLHFFRSSYDSHSPEIRKVHNWWQSRSIGLRAFVIHGKRRRKDTVVAGEILAKRCATGGGFLAAAFGSSRCAILRLSDRFLVWLGLMNDDWRISVLLFHYCRCCFCVYCSACFINIDLFLEL